MKKRARPKSKINDKSLCSKKTHRQLRFLCRITERQNKKLKDSEFFFEINIGSCLRDLSKIGRVCCVFHQKVKVVNVRFVGVLKIARRACVVRISHDPLRIGTKIGPCAINICGTTAFEQVRYRHAHMRNKKESCGLRAIMALVNQPFAIKIARDLCLCFHDAPCMQIGLRAVVFVAIESCKGHCSIKSVSLGHWVACNV